MCLKWKTICMLTGCISDMSKSMYLFYVMVLRNGEPMGMPLQYGSKFKQQMELQGESLVWPFMWFTSVNISCMLLLSRLDNALPMYFSKNLWTIYIPLYNWASEYIFSLASCWYSHIQRSVITSGTGHQSLESVRNMTRGHPRKHEHMGMDILRKGQAMCWVCTFFFIRLQSKWVCVLSWVHVNNASENWETIPM